MTDEKKENITIKIAETEKKVIVGSLKSLYILYGGWDN